MLSLLLICLGSLISCATSKPVPTAIWGKDVDDWNGHEGGICFSKEYAQSYLHWKNNK